MSRDTLLLLSTSYPEHGDGSEAAGAFVADVAEALSERMHVRVLAPGRAPSIPSASASVPVWRFSGTGQPLSLLSATRPVDWPAIASVLASMRRQARAASADGRVAHSLALWTLPSGWVAHGLWRKHAIPYSVWALGSDIWTLGRVPLVSSLLRRVIADASHRFADGLQLAEDAERLGGHPFEFLPSTRRTLVEHPSAPSTRAPWRLLFLGRWHPNKGVDLLLDALSMLSEGTWERIGEITVAGGGPLEADVRSSVEQLIKRGRPMVLRGFLSTGDAAAAIQAADWVIIPSRIESIPVVLSDALKAGRPVITTAVGDMERLVSGPRPCGVIAERPTAQAIANAIQRAVDTGPAVFVEGVRHAAMAFDLDRIATRLRDAAMPSGNQQE